jgi:hypothetical protein
MNSSQQIYLNTNDVNTDKYVKVRLEQNIDTLEFLSMSIDVKDIYNNFNADYGVLVGRVTANDSIGIPNAKISVFIPISDEDATNGEIYGIYPYRTPRDKNFEGKRYNLLPRVSKKDPITKIISPKQPFGSFPIKEEIVTNEIYLNIYKKYYKHIAITNNSGDYMIYGVPIGTQTIHLSVDITDIGKYSMSPAAMVTNLGYSPNFFTDNNTKIKSSDDLNDLPHIETQEISVEIIPFWGDSENFEIGITQQNFRIRSVLKNTFIIFGSAFTDGAESMWGSVYDTARNFRELYHITGTNPNDYINRGIQSKRLAKVTEKIYYYPSTISDNQIISGNVDPDKDMLVLDSTEYSSYKRDGDFVFIINCNRNKVIIDEGGNEIAVPDSSSNGIYTKFRGFMTLEISEDDLPLNNISPIDNDKNFKQLRYKFKFPQHGDYYGLSNNYNILNLYDLGNVFWKNQHFIFSGGGLYSISRFHGVLYNNGDAPRIPRNPTEGFYFNPQDNINDVFGIIDNNVGLIETSNTYITGNTKYGLVPNVLYGGSKQHFGANWLNLSVYFPQISYVNRINPSGTLIYGGAYSNYNFTPSPYFINMYVDNNDPIAAGQVNTKWYARSDLHWTDFINVPKEDIKEMNNIESKGFTNNYFDIPLKGIYRNGINIPQNGLNNNLYINIWSKPCPDNGGKEGGYGLAEPDTQTYFYKGFDTANCIEYLISLGLV